jgi:RNA 2',3'-cyclic 3'-phosphodiesterase
MTPAERLKSPRVRLFVALDLPDPFLDELTAWQQAELGERGDLRLPSRFSLHVTLVFLGYQAERDVDRIAELSFSEPPPAFELCATEVVEVPPRRPRLYALAMTDEGEALGRWQAGLSERLHEARLYEPEKRPFWPHVTLARVKRDARVGREFEPPELPAELAGPFRTGRVTLFRSTLQRSGAVYEPLASIDS